MSLWWAIVLYNFVSSANMNTFESTQSGKSLINTTNKIGPSTEPCRIPLVTLCHGENSPLTCTRCLRLLRKLRIHKHVWSLILYDLSLFMRALCRTLSKAFMKSVYIASIAPPSSSTCMLVQCSRTTSNCSAVDLPPLNLNCLLLNKLWRWKWSTIFFLISFSMILQCTYDTWSHIIFSI
jgi:hypothetical protein